MAVPDVVYGEKRLSLLSFLPGARVITPRIVPEFLWVASIGSPEVVVGFGTIAGVVSCFLEKLVVEADGIGDFKTAAHWLSAIGNGMHTGDPRGSGRGANRSVVETVEITKTFLGQLIDVWGLGIFAAVAAHPFDAIILAGNPKNVGLFRLAG